MNLGIIIQARTGSTRLPQKMLKLFYKNETILDILLKRLVDCNLNLPIIVATSDSEDDSKIVDIAKRNNIDFFQGNENDVLNRFICAAEKFSLTHIIRVCADNPFLSMDYLLQLINSDKIFSNDYVSFITSKGIPSIKTHYGFWCEFISVEALKKINNITTKAIYHEHVTNYAYENKDLFKCDFINIDRKIENSVFRLTVDTQEDFCIAQDLYKKLIEENLSVEPNNIIKLIDKNLINRMSIQITNNSK